MNQLPLTLFNMTDFTLFGRCAACKKRKLYTSKPWIKPTHLPRVKPLNKLCNACIKNITKTIQ